MCIGCTCQVCRPDLHTPKDLTEKNFVANITIGIDGQFGAHRGSLKFNQLALEILTEASRNGKDLIEVITRLVEVGSHEIAPGQKWGAYRAEILGVSNNQTG